MMVSGFIVDIRNFHARSNFDYFSVFGQDDLVLGHRSRCRINQMAGANGHLLRKRRSRKQQNERQRSREHLFILFSNERAVIR